MASELRQVMRELRAEVASHSDVRVEPPHVYMWLYWSERNVSGRGVATCHPRDTFNPDTGETIAYGRAVKDAAKKLLARTWSHPQPQVIGNIEQDAFHRAMEGALARCWRPVAPTEQGDEEEERGPWYKCGYCEKFEQSQRDKSAGLCHGNVPYVAYSDNPACGGGFRLREEEPPEDAGDVVTGTLETFAEAPGLHERVEALDLHLGRLDTETRAWTEGFYEQYTELRGKVTDLEAKVACLPTLASLVENIHRDALPAIYRWRSALERKVGDLDTEGVTLRGRLLQIECWRERSEQDLDSV